MRWSKLKKTVEDKFADSIKGKVELWSTAYRKPNSSTGRGWITIEGKELVNFATILSWVNFGGYFHESSDTPYWKHPAVKNEERNEGNLIEEGEFSTNLFRLQADYDITPEVSISSTVQYDDLGKVLGMNQRFRWVITPGSDLFFVYNHNWFREAGEFQLIDRSNILKANYTHRF